MVGTVNETHYDCTISKNGGSIFVARFQKAKDAVDFKKRNKIVDIEEITNRYYFAEGNNCEI